MKKYYSQPYVKINRSITSNRQTTVEEQDFLHLYEEKIITGEHVFTMKEVLDVSFRIFSSSNGILYLHTIQGVFPYRVMENPQQFIAFFREIKRNTSHKK